MSDFMYGKAVESLREFGFLAPVVVRHHVEGHWEIVDGEHRYKAAVDLGRVPIPCFSVDGLSDAEAKKATLLLNELHGQMRPDKLTELFRDLHTELDAESFLTALPYTPEVLRSFLPELAPLPVPAGMLGSPSSSTPASSPLPKERWVERLYKLPESAAAILDEAILKAKEGREVDNWQALEAICADFLAG